MAMLAIDKATVRCRKQVWSEKSTTHAVRYSYKSTTRNTARWVQGAEMTLTEDLG